MTPNKKENKNIVSIRNNIVVIFLLIILLGFDIYSRISYLCITDESIVLSFVGILATFIVIGNYAQVKDVKDETSKKFNAINELIEKNNSENNEKFQRLKNEIYNYSVDNIKIEIGLFERDFASKSNEELEAFCDKLSIYTQESQNVDLQRRVMQFYTNLLTPTVALKKEKIEILCRRIEDPFYTISNIGTIKKELDELTNTFYYGICQYLKWKRISNCENYLFCLNTIGMILENRRSNTEKISSVYEKLKKSLSNENLEYVKFWEKKFHEKDARHGFPVYDKEIEEWVNGLKKNE
ncbi:MAG: hypothetical protein J6Y55_06400 [Bacteroidales bacterium]|nr:hypothetical protein [Bacteroidales bacterium]